MTDFTQEEIDAVYRVMAVRRDMRHFSSDPLAGSRPVAVLCLGYVRDFYPRPMLEMADWAQRCSVASLVQTNYWSGGRADPRRLPSRSMTDAGQAPR